MHSLIQVDLAQTLAQEKPRLISQEPPRRRAEPPSGGAVASVAPPPLPTSRSSAGRALGLTRMPSWQVNHSSLRLTRNTAVE